MKTYILSAVIALAALYSPAVSNPSPPLGQTVTTACELENQVFQNGEKITYALYYNLKPFWIKAGEVTFVMSENDTSYFVEAKGRTARSFEWFYKVRDTYTCEIDKATLKPIQSTRNIREGGYRKVSKAKYDFENNKVVALTGKTEESLKEIIMDMDDCMHDILSIIYYARNIDYTQMTEGSMVPANIFLDDEKYNLGFKYMGAERKKIKKLGKVDAVILKPQLAAGHVFEEDTEMTIWVSDDGNRLPLMIESPVSVGSVKAVLRKHENLKFSLVTH